MNKGKQQKVAYRWRTLIPMLVRGMLLADKTFFIAGPMIGKNLDGLAELDTIQPGSFWAVSAADGEVLSRYKLAASPVLDGMTAAGGRLYMATTDGKVLCFSGDE